MKKVTRLIAILLLSAMMVSCGGTAVQLPDFINETKFATDFDGYVIDLYFDGESDDDDENHLFGWESNSIEEGAMLTRMDNIEKDYNCTIIPHYDLSRENARLKMQSGFFDGDLVYYSGFGGMQDFAKAKMLYPLTDFPDQIDLSDSEKYGGANVLEGAMIDGKPYAVQPLYWPGFQALDCFFVVYNSDEFAANGLTDLHEFYENETWTWDTYEKELLEAAANLNLETSEGIMPTLYTRDSNLFSCLMYSNNTQFITKTSSGTNLVNPYPTEFATALETGVSWLNTYGKTIDLSAGFWELDDFLEGNALTTLATSTAVTTGGVAYNDKGSFIHKIMPFPCGPNAKYGQWAQYMQRIEGFGIPVTCPEPEIAAQVLSLLFDPLEELGDLRDYYSGYTFNTELDAEIYFNAGQFVRYDYTFDGGSDLGRTVSNYFGGVLGSTRSAQEAMEAYRDAMITFIENHMLENFDYMYENYYYQFED